jgi:hypothetical protein
VVNFGSESVKIFSSVNCPETYKNFHALVLSLQKNLKFKLRYCDEYWHHACFTDSAQFAPPHFNRKCGYPVWLIPETFWCTHIKIHNGQPTCLFLWHWYISYGVTMLLCRMLLFSSYNVWISQQLIKLTIEIVIHDLCYGIYMRSFFEAQSQGSKRGIAVNTIPLGANFPSLCYCSCVLFTDHLGRPIHRTQVQVYPVVSQ